MQQFASKTPRDLNHDPLPLVEPSGNRADILSARGTYEPGTFGALIESPRYDPRPEFDHVQHNGPNPILVGLRSFRNSEAFTTDPRGLYASWNFTFNRANVPDSALVAILHPGSSVEHVSHARRVLTRLVNLSKEN